MVLLVSTYIILLGGRQPLGHRDGWRDIKVFAKVFLWDRYNLVLLVSTYIILLGCMALCYARMGANLWGTEMVGEI